MQSSFSLLISELKSYFQTQFLIIGCDYAGDNILFEVPPVLHDPSIYYKTGLEARGSHAIPFLYFLCLAWPTDWACVDVCANKSECLHTNMHTAFSRSVHNMHHRLK